jgi:hypothetical protein
LKVTKRGVGKGSYPSCFDVERVSHCETVRKQDGGKSTFRTSYGRKRWKTGTQIRHNVEI